MNTIKPFGKKYNVLFMHYGSNLIRGSEIVLLNILKSIDTNSFNPIVCCNTPIFYRELQKLDLECYQIVMTEIMIDGKENRSLNFIKYFYNLIHLLKISKDKNIDLVYCNSGLPVQTGIFIAKYLQVPIICHIHSPFTKRYYYIWLLSFLNKIIFCSENTKNKSLFKVNFKGNSVRILNGIDTDYFRKPDENIIEKATMLRSQYGISSYDIVIAQIGSLIYRKGIDILLNAFKKIIANNYNVKLMLIGDGDDRSDFEKLCTRLKIEDNVLFIGEIKNTVHYLQHIIDINILASRHESLPLSLIEAASCGIPNICSDCDGNPEIVTDGITGYTFKVGDIDMLVNKTNILINNPNLRREFGINGRKKVMDFFTMNNFITSIENEIRASIMQYQY
jgi:glycosyltransferase involved in cell wall biosynthesis